MAHYANQSRMESSAVPRRRSRISSVLITSGPTGPHASWLRRRSAPSLSSPSRPPCPYPSPPGHHPHPSRFPCFPAGTRVPQHLQDREQPPPPPLIVDGQARVPHRTHIDSKYNRTRRKCQLSYHVKWVGYPISNNPSDWILADAFDDEAGSQQAQTGEISSGLGK
jgi:hypothetical protein